MYSTHPVYSKNVSIVCLLVIFWFVYLSTLSPTVFYRDTPEFINTAFTLGISHPAGFPIYNLMAKAVTFFPMGSVPFKINLFSSLMGCLALGVLYLASITFLRVLFGPEHSDSFAWPAVLPVGFLAACVPFWGNTMLAEVYTLHALFTILIILCLLKWKEKEDIRYLYSGALVYGLSAGNHGTVAFYLPAILILFFFWCRNERWRHLSFCVSFFILGFSIYLYLPIRSLTEPTFDWGNPETLEGFLFQITDRKDTQTHFNVINSTVASLSSEGQNSASALDWIVGLFSSLRKAGVGFVVDIYNNFSMLSVIGFLVGAILCVRKSVPFFLFCAVIVGTNIVFFVDWRGEAYLPSYIVVALFTSLALYRLLFTSLWHQQGSISVNDPDPRGVMGSSKLIGGALLLAIGLSIPWSLWKNYTRVDHSWNHLSENMTRKVYLALPDRSVFVSGLSWFFYNFNQDVRRLRDDVTTVTVWDLLSPHRTGLLTDRRYPNLYLPDTKKHNLKSLEGISDYTQEFLEKNAALTPVVMEHNSIMQEQTKFASNWRPYRNILLQYDSPVLSLHQNKYSYRKSWEEYKSLLEEELSRKNSGRDMDWLNNPKVWFYSMADYFHITERYELEREVLTMIGNFLGQNSNPQWKLQLLDNLISDGRLEEATFLLDSIKERAPDSYEKWLGEGLVYRFQGKWQLALDALRKAELLDSRSFRTKLEIAKTLNDLKMDQPAQAALLKAQSSITNIRELMAFKKLLHQEQ